MGHSRAALRFMLPGQDDELELILAKTPEPGEAADAVLLGKQLYFAQQHTDEDLLRTLRPYKDVQARRLSTPVHSQSHTETHRTNPACSKPPTFQMDTQVARREG